MPEHEVTWRKCDYCDLTYFIGAVLSPRTHLYSPIALSEVPEDEVGNFRIDWDNEQEVFDEDDSSIGVHPVVVYGTGVYRPHSPSHFLEDIHVIGDGDGVWFPRLRMRNFKMPMEERV
jgi:hypothetical protein